MGASSLTRLKFGASGVRLGHPAVGIPVQSLEASQELLDRLAKWAWAHRTQLEKASSAERFGPSPIVTANILAELRRRGPSLHVVAGGASPVKKPTLSATAGGRREVGGSRSAMPADLVKELTSGKYKIAVISEGDNPKAPSLSLVAVLGDTRYIKHFLISKRDRISLGRISRNDVVVEDREGGVSRRHLRIVWREGHFVVEDLNSTNGTYLNGSSIQQAVLRPGDRLRVGSDVEWIVWIGGEPSQMDLEFDVQLAGGEERGPWGRKPTLPGIFLTEIKPQRGRGIEIRDRRRDLIRKLKAETGPSILREMRTKSPRYPGGIPAYHRWNFVIYLKDGAFRVRMADTWDRRAPEERGIKHDQLAKGRPCVFAGTMRIEEAGSGWRLVFDNNSGAYGTQIDFEGAKAVKIEIIQDLLADSFGIPKERIRFERMR